MKKLNKKGVEGLPLKYVIIAIVAVFSLAMALQVTNVMSQGVTGALIKINQTLNETLIP